MRQTLRHRVNFIAFTLSMIFSHFLALFTGKTAKNYENIFYFQEYNRNDLINLMYIRKL